MLQARRVRGLREGGYATNVYIFYELTKKYGKRQLNLVNQNRKNTWKIEAKVAKLNESNLHSAKHSKSL